jgi:hypothetical protein
VFFDGTDITRLRRTGARLRIGRTFQIDPASVPHCARERHAGDSRRGGEAGRCHRDRELTLLPTGYWKKSVVGHAQHTCGIAHRRCGSSRSRWRSPRKRVCFAHEPLAGIAAGEAAAMISLLQRSRALRASSRRTRHDAVFALADRGDHTREGRLPAGRLPR